jgi:butyrate kinase
MFDLEKLIENELSLIQQSKPTVVFSESLDPRVLEAACYLARFCRPVFLAPEESIRKVISEEVPGLEKTRVDFTMSESTFVDIPSRKEMIGEFAGLIMENEKEAAGNLEDALKLAREPARFGIYCVKAGYADMVVGGAVYEPIEFFRPALKVLKQQDIQCEAGIFILPDDYPTGIFPHNIVAFGDVGVNATLTPEVLANIAVGTCAVVRDVIPEAILPEIYGALVSYSNKGSDEGPSPELVRQATKLIPAILAERVKLGKRYESIRIEGEVKVSSAISRRSAAHYFKDDKKAEELAGRYNVIIAPNLELGNFLYHLFSTRYPDAKKFAAIFGLRFRTVDLAMDCTSEDIRLGIKANLLRHHRFGHWKETPKDMFFKKYRILAVNPGSTSTKISLFEGDVERFSQEIQHSAEDLKPFEGQPIVSQFPFRKEIILKLLEEKGYKVEDLDAVSGRGGLLKPIPHGTYAVDDAMTEYLISCKGGEHASNLGALIAKEVVAGTKAKAFVVDPVVVDEVPVRAKITGIKEIRRTVISHALNQIASARRYADANETFYENINVIVCHMGGGISIGAHKKGRYIDVNQALDGEGPFSPQRSGSLPVGALIELCFSGKYTKKELKLLNKGRGGLIDLLGTTDLRDVEKRIEAGDKEAGEVFGAMAYQIAKEIASVIPAFDGEKVDQVILTGGMARSGKLIEAIKSYIAALDCGVTVYPGENEMLSLAKGAIRVLNGKESAKVYGGGHDEADN